MGHSLYRLWLRKGTPFTLALEHNPPVEHDGGNTVAHLYLTSTQAEIVREWVGEKGCEYRLIPHERQTEEQTKERQTLLGMQRGDRVWPSASCPTCAWFDPLLEGEPCGRAGWPPESIEAFDADLSHCPVKHLWGG